MKQARWKKLLAAVTAGALLAGMAWQAGWMPEGARAQVAQAAVESAVTTQAPKYVFLFIGDGMSYPQIQAAADYQGAMKQGAEPAVLAGPLALPFMRISPAAAIIMRSAKSWWGAALITLPAAGC